MRDIKFRAYHIEKEKMINIKNLLSFSSDGDIWINENKQTPINTFSGWASKDFNLMQYTGLRDINDVEIYEGDILKSDINEVLGVVCFEDGKFVVNWENISEDLFEWTGEFIIGNIYENSELLENEKKD